MRSKKKSKMNKKITRRQKGGSSLKNITLGILSWKSCKTLVNTLESYKNNNLLNLVTPIVYFQEMSDIEPQIAKKYSLNYIGTDKNVGIQKALVELINNTTTKYFLFAENDFVLTHNENELTKVLNDCINLIDNNDVKLVKLRDIKNPGEPLYSKNIYENDFKGKPNQQDFRYKLEALSFVDNPEETFPNVFTVINLNYKWYKCSNKNNVWSNNVFIASTEWLKNSVIPLLDVKMDNTGNKQMFEDVLINKLDNYNLAAGQGLFTHNRIEHGDCSIENIQTGGKKKLRKTRKILKGGNQKPTIHCISVSTKDNEGLQRLLNSAKANNVTIEILGLDMNTDKLGHSAKQKFGMKLRLPQEYLKKVADNDLILFSDAWDVIYIDNLDNIYDKYLKFNKPVVFGAELFAWPDSDKASEYVDTQNEYFKYLNSGLYMGNAKVLKQMLSNYKGGEDIDDQRFWVDMYFKNRDKIVLDVKAELFLDAAGTDKADYDFSTGKFVFKKTNTSPSIIHANSSDKTYLDLFNSMIGGGTTDAYTINLSDREDRRNTITEKFKNSSINILIFSVERHPGGAHAGCGDSFLKVIQKAKEINLPAVLIFEDDNMPLENFDSRWQKTKEWLDANMDKWEVFNGGARIYDNPTITLKYKVSDDINLFEVSRFFGTNWMYINSSVYDKVLQWNIDTNGGIDRYLGDNSIFKNLCIYPYLGLQEVGISNSWGKHMNLRNDNVRMKNIFQQELDKQKGGDNTIYIKKTNIAETEALYPFLKNIYPNKKIEFVDDRDTYDLIVISCLNDEPPKQPYILICGEQYHAVSRYNFNDPNCVAYFLSTKHPDTKNIKNYYYFPLFLTIGHTIYDSSPFIKDYSDTPKTRLCAFIAHKETDQRTKMFQALLAEDTTATTDALGNALHNKDVSLPQFWWDLPEVYKDYKFILAIENNDTEEGYITEKIMNGYRASCVPIYWGTSSINEIFNPDSFINLKNYTNSDGTIDYTNCAKEIVAIGNDEVRYNKMKNAPIFNTNMDPDYSKFYDTPSPQWVIDISNEIKKRLNPTIGGSKKKRLTRKKKKMVGGNKKEISCFFPAYLPSVNAGAEQMAHAINKFLASKGYIINVIGNWDTQQYDGLNLISSNDTQKMNEAVDRSSIIITQQNSSDYAVNLGKEKNKFVVIIVHNTQRNFYDLEKFKTILDPSKLFLIFNSEWVKNDYNIDINSMVLYPPVNCDDYKTETTHDYVTLINVSELKGGNQLIEIAKKMPDIKFLGVEGGYDEQIKDTSVPNITYIPNTPNVKDDVYSKTDILLMPSSAETWGRTATEALCSGIPVIASPTPGLKENLSSAGIFIDRNNVGEWINTIRKLKNDRNYYKEISDNCIKRSNELNPANQFQELYNTLQSVQEGGNNTIYIKKIELMDELNEYLLPILRNIYPNKHIEFCNDRESFDLILKSDNLGSNMIKGDKKYIYVSCESYDTVKAGGVFEDKYCVAKILSTQDKRLDGMNDVFYLPYFLNTGPKIHTKTPFIREFTNKDRVRLAAYIARNPAGHRSEFFKELKTLNNKVNGLGPVNHTMVNTEMPPRDKTYELPKIYKKYKFGFAMESKDEEGYITEKIMNVYRGGAIPIYWGTSKIKDIFNIDSFIYINDYSSFKEAANEIIKISNDTTKLHAMQEAPIFKENIGNIDYSKYYDTPSPQWVIDIANKIKILL